MNSESEIHKIINDSIEAIRAKNIEKLMPGYAPDVVQFDVVDPLQYKGSDGIKKRMNDWFSSFKSPIGYDVRELEITASENIAFCHSLNGVNAIKTDGGKLEMWWRTTMCFRKIGSKWLITHVHSSVPFDPVTGKASTELKPDNI